MMDERHPRLFKFICAVARFRTPAAFVIPPACVAEQLYFHREPLGLDEPLLTSIGLGLIAAGVAFRIAALGCRSSEPHLYTTSAYSLCRHPLYLGSIVITFGFCVLLDNPVAFLAAAAYFSVFYSATIVREEVRLRRRFGEVHEDYCRRTPCILPLGRLRAKGFNWAAATKSGALRLLLWVAVFLVGVEVLAKAMQA